MNWRNDLRNKTRQPAFLWRMVLGIIALGIALGYLAQHFHSDTTSPLPTKTERAGVERLDVLAEQGEWWQLWWAIPRVDLQRRFGQLGPAALAGFAGCCWLAFALQAAGVRGFRDPRLALAVAALLLGAMSVWPTQFFNYWQEAHWNLHPDFELAAGLRYFVLGVGLREELAKLLCLLPLMPLLLRQRNELAALMTAACVGLGFAMAENAGYFLRSGGIDALGRFLTANPFHMTLTGLAGLALYRGLRYPKAWGPQALALFGLLVFAHGLYDAAIVIPALGDYALLGTILFIVIVYQFFRELRELRSARTETISLTANFLCGVSLVTAATFVYLSATVGCSVAFDTLAQDAVGLAVMVYLFLREMPETMVTV